MVDAASTAAAEDALQRELDLIEQYDIAPLFMFFCDFAAALARNNIPVQAIGIAGGSMVLFASRLSHVFPPDEGLLFEHFFDGSKFDSVGRQVNLSLDVPATASNRLLAKWKFRTRSVKANGLGIRIELTRRRYLSLYRRLKTKRSLPSPTRIRSFWSEIEPGRILAVLNQFFPQDHFLTSRSRSLPPLTWSHLLLLCGGRQNHAADAELFDNIVAQLQHKQHLDAGMREDEANRWLARLFWHREDVMVHAGRFSSGSPALVSRLMLAICKNQQERIDQLKEAFLETSDSSNCPAWDVESAMRLVFDRAPYATSKAHACCRALWTTYLAYASQIPR